MKMLRKGNVIFFFTQMFFRKKYENTEMFRLEKSENTEMLRCHRQKNGGLHHGTDLRCMFGMTEGCCPSNYYIVRIIAYR